MTPSNEVQMEEVAAIERVLAGEPEAFQHLVERHSRPLFRLAYRMTGNQHDADDVVQETLLRAYRQIGRFQARSSFSTWLHRIAVNCALDLIKARDRRDHATPEEIDPVRFSVSGKQHQAVESAEVRQAVARALDRLTANERAAFVLRHYEGCSIEEIGATLGTKVNATKNTIFRAVRKLREELAPMVRATS